MAQFATLVVKSIEENPICPCCGRPSTTVEMRHRNTAYADDTLNYLLSCEECFQEDWEYYQERWNDYYSDIIGGLW